MWHHESDTLQTQPLFQRTCEYASKPELGSNSQPLYNICHKNEHTLTTLKYVWAKNIIRQRLFMEKMMNLSVVEPRTRMIDLQKNSTSYYNST